MSQLNFSLSHTSEPAHRLIMRGDNYKQGRRGQERRDGSEEGKREGKEGTYAKR